MSEYQYYEWLAIDRPLTAAEVRAVNGLSSHMDTVTSTQAIVTYQWGDFKHDPIDVLLKYFDAMLYFANWGTRELAFRFPKAAIDAEQLRAYVADDWLSLSERVDFYVLHIGPGEEGEPPDEFLEWSLGQFVPMRQQIIDGDYRAPYLAWLAWVTREAKYVVEDENEGDLDSEAEVPSVPPGLKHLDASLEALIEFADIDPFLVRAAAEVSPDLPPGAVEYSPEALAALPVAEARRFLERLLAGEPQLRTALRRRLQELSGPRLESAAGPRLTLAQLVLRAQELREEAARKRQEAERRRREEAARRRRQALEALALRADEAWREAEGLIERRQAGAYDQAVAILKDLHDAAAIQDSTPPFNVRLADLKRQYHNRPALQERLHKAGL